MAGSYVYWISPILTFSSVSSSMTKKAPMLLLCVGSATVPFVFLVHVIVLSVVVCTLSMSSPPPYEMVFIEADEVTRASA